VLFDKNKIWIHSTMVYSCKIIVLLCSYLLLPIEIKNQIEFTVYILLSGVYMRIIKQKII
jgi:hypothetical protein